MKEILKLNNGNTNTRSAIAKYDYELFKHIKGSITTLL